MGGCPGSPSKLLDFWWPGSGGEVEIRRRTVQQQVANRSADEVQLAILPLEGLRQGLHGAEF
jgi:hypothetical protein